MLQFYSPIFEDLKQLKKEFLFLLAAFIYNDKNVTF